MVADLCRAVNVVRNMNKDQMIETATKILDECGNLRLQDYAIIVKRGQLARILDRLDIHVIGEMLDVFWLSRCKSGESFM
jgi:hypothetical protein